MTAILEFGSRVEIAYLNQALERVEVMLRT